ncbi:MAG TPA: response regulator, partial [Burkholderiales bacterium]|nr:response regulator [Burkholderiales bacterium]
REYARRLLAADYDVEAVANGEAALAAARARRPELVVSDVMMPGLDGFGLLRALRADPALRTVPVILLSARAGEEARIEGLGVGADDYLVKPFSARELLVRVGALLRSAEIRREAQKALRKTERRYRTVLGLMPAAVYTCEAPGGAITYYNEHAARLWGRAPALGDTDERFCGSLRLWRPDGTALPHAAAPMALAMREGCPFRNEEVVIERPDGTRITVLVNIDPLRDEDGKLVGAINVFHDVSERRQAEEALRESEARYRAVVESQAEMVCRFRMDGTILFVNGAYARARGTTSEALAGTNFWSFISEADRVHVRAMLERLTPEAPEARIENRFQTTEGERWTLWTNRALAFDADRRVLEAQSTGVDITERKCMEAALREADRAKDEFLATLSHELRNPLAPLRNSLHLLRRADPQRAQPIHDMMERQVNHLVRLVDDLMDMSRIARGSLELRREAVTLQAVLKNAIETSEPLISDAGHRLQVSLPAEALPLEADPVRLSQVFANLLNNAARYTPARGDIRIEARREHGEAVVEISDTGEGIEPAELPRLFEMFSQGERTSRRSQGGLGIGLAIVRRLVQMHGGSVLGRSEGLGKGSCFTVRLPLGAAAGSAAHGVLAQSAKIAPHRVLVVDDNRDAASSLGMLLGFLGADVAVAHDGTGALEAFERYRPDIVLLDIGMPGMNGYDVARAIRRRSQGERVALVALTGWGQEQDRRRAHDAGFDHHFIKPADIGALQSLLSGLTLHKLS